MPSYVIFIRDRLTNKAEMDTYAALARQARGDHPIKPLIYYGPAFPLEGPPVDGVVVLEFPTTEAARAWYESPAYQDAKAHRLNGADYRVILAEGVPAA